MKKRIRFYAFLIINLIFFSPFLVAKAADVKFYCNYKVRYGDGKSTFPLKIAVYNKNSADFYNAENKKIKSGASLVINSKGETFGDVKLSFDSKDFAKQASGSGRDQCPPISLNQSNNFLYKLLNYDAGNQDQVFVTPSVAPTYPSGADNKNEKKVTKACNIDISNLGSLSFSGTIIFRMYNDGQKEFCLQQSGTNSCAEVNNSSEVNNLTFQSGTAYYFRIYKDQVPHIFKQGNLAMVNNNTFTCPSNIYVYYDTQSEVGQQYYYITTDKNDTDGANEYVEPEVEEGEENSSNGSAIDFGEDFTDACEVVPPEIKTWIINILKIVRYIALALVIVLGALDFLKAAGSGEPDQMKKAGQSFLKRVIAVAVLFLLPYIVELILGLIDMFGVNTNCVDPGSI